MRIDGEWLLCDDGITRPILRAEVLAEDGRWQQAEFLIDSGADRTVFSANLLAALAFRAIAKGEEIRGVGGCVATTAVTTQIRLTCDDDRKVVLCGQFVGCDNIDVLDTSVLGRDAMQLFVAIVDRPGSRVMLLGEGHSYFVSQGITQSPK